MSSVAQFGNIPVIGVGQLTTANTNRAQTTATGLVALLTGNTIGTVINRIDFQATATTAAGMLRLWIYSGTGTVYSLALEQATVGITPSGTTKAEYYSIFPSNMVLPSGWILYASTQNSETWEVNVYGANI